MMNKPTKKTKPARPKPDDSVEAIRQRYKAIGAHNLAVWERAQALKRKRGLR